MAFSWRRIRKSGSIRKRVGPGEEMAAGHFADAPIQNVHVPFALSPHDWTTLWGAAGLGYTRILSRMLAGGEPVNQRDDAGRTALFYAVEGGQRDAAEILLARGADPNLRDETGRAPLHLALAQKDKPLVELLLENRADPDAGAGDFPTPLMEAARRGDESAILRLLRAGARVDTVDRFGYTVLFFVNGRTAAKVLPVLLDAGADPLARALDRDTPRHRALRIGDERLWRALTPADDELAMLGERGRMGDLPLHAAAESGNPALVKRLLKLGAEIDAANDFGHTALLLALTRESLPVATLLRNAGARVGFLEAVALGDAERAAECPSSGDLSAPVGGVETPLMGAVARGREDLVRILLARGARIDVATRSLGTALDVAVRTGQADLARLLIEKGTDPAAVLKVHPREVRLLLAEVEALPPDATLHERPSAEAIYEAATAASDDDLRWLALLGANVETMSENGDTALLLAVADGDAPAVRRLLAFGADPTARNRADETPADLARRLDRKEALAFLDG